MQKKLEIEKLEDCNQITGCNQNTNSNKNNKNTSCNQIPECNKTNSQSKETLNSCCIRELVNRVDIYIGKRVKEKRIALGISQKDFAKKLGITFQQIQKYENGSNRIGSGRLFTISIILKTDISYFYENCNCLSCGLDNQTSLGDLASPNNPISLNNPITSDNNQQGGNNES